MKSNPTIYMDRAIMLVNLQVKFDFRCLKLHNQYYLPDSLWRCLNIEVVMHREIKSTTTRKT